MATHDQISYIAANLFMPKDTIRSMTVEQAQEAIQAIKSIYNTLPPAKRYEGINALSRQLTNKLKPDECDRCQKPFTNCHCE